jgi:hypothetical protein
MGDVNDFIYSEAVENANTDCSDDETEAAQNNDDEQFCFTGFDDL